MKTTTLVTLISLVLSSTTLVVKADPYTPVFGDCGDTVNQDTCVSVGKDSVAGHNGTSVGVKSNTGNAATGIGYRANASGSWSTAVGWGATSTGGKSVAVGNNSQAQAYGTSAVGHLSNAEANYSTAVGDTATATGENSVALGAGSVADEANTVSVGSATNQRRITNMAEGVNGTDGVNVNQLNKKANETLINANHYTDTKVEGITQTAINTSNTYTDQQVTNEASARTDGDKKTLDDSKGYTDGQVSDEATKRVDGDKKTASDSRQYTDNKFNQVNGNFRDLRRQIDDNKDRADAGIAGVAAMANIPQVTDSQTFSVGAGVGTRSDEGAMAVGFSARASDHVVLKASVAGDTEQTWTVGGGVSYGW